MISYLIPSAVAQDSENAAPSLGDVARQARTQHPSDAQPSKAQVLVDDMQSQQEAAQNAPTGFTNYDAGEYRLFVPYPFSLEGRDNGGPVLMGSRLGVTNTEVLAGVPISIPSDLSDIDLANLVRELAALHGRYASCSPARLSTHKAFLCYWNDTPYLLGHQVWGNMEIVVGSSSLIPVMCVSPDEFQCLGYDQFGYHTCNNRNPSWQEVQETKGAIATRFRDELTTKQMCEQIIYPSIQLKEDIVVHPAAIREEKPGKPPTPVPQDISVAASGEQTPSLGDLARRTRQAPHAPARASLVNSEGGAAAPAGYQSFVVTYCQNPEHCSEATVVIPEKAEVVSRVNGQHIFKATLNGSPVMLYAGPADVNAPYRSMTDPDYIRLRDLANANGWSREKTDGVSTQELSIDGLPALMTRFRYQRDQKRWWVGERALIDMPESPYIKEGSQFLIGCTAPEETFAEAEALCTTLVNSLRLP
ncbi:MAG TPA: hypothetical protein VMG31_09280 [Verrucomicrobiae bacterium]|nr:hypothetical protein [Verrucomicrobiae bacterium]